MVRLIDADKINFKWINGVICVEPKDIEKMPTVEAVPVSFLLKLQETAVNDEASEIINEIIARWEREREEE